MARRNAAIVRLLCCGLVAAGILALSSPAHAQRRRLRFSHLSVEDGLSNTWVQSILKDSQGFLWIGTNDGLNRYDGVRCTVYRTQPGDPQSLPASRVTAIFEDSRKRLWIGTPVDGGGLALFDRETERFERYALPFDATVGFVEIYSIVEDHQGRLWIGTKHGLIRLDPEKKTSIKFLHDPRDSSTLSSDTVYWLLKDQQERLWIGTEKGLDRIDPASGKIDRWARRGDASDILASANISHMYLDSDGLVWVASIDAGLLRLDPRTFQVKRYSPNLGDPESVGTQRIRRVAGDGRGTIYLGTEDDGLNVLDTRTGKCARYHPDSEDATSLAALSLWALLLDDQDTLWIGTINAGMDSMSPLGQRFGLLTARRDGLSDPHVAAVVEDHLGNLWIGTDGGGLNHLDRKTGRFTYYRHDSRNPHGLASDAVLAVFEDSQQNLWVGSWSGGLQRLDGQSGRFATYLPDPEHPGSFTNTVWTIIEESRGSLLIGTQEGGVHAFDRKTAKFTRLPDVYPRMSTSIVNVVVEDSRGNVWLHGPQGLAEFERSAGRFHQYRHDPQDARSLGPGDVEAVYPDSRGNVWVGTDRSGLNCIEAGSGKVHHYTVADGLPDNNVSAILEDAAGNLWLSTARGLAKFEDAVGLPTRPRVLAFDVHDGLQGYEFRRGAAFKSRSGEMFFGGQRGLTYFHPADVHRNQHIPPVVLTDLRLFNKSVGLDTPGSPLKKTITQTQDLVLSYKDSVVTFEFAALNFVLPQKNQYGYKLEGFDRDWNEVGTQRTATYTNLPQGSYTFRVRGSNNDGVWNEKGLSLKLLVTPPFWKTWWFLAALGLTLVASTMGSYQLRVRQHVRAERELQARVTAALADIKTLHGLLPICAWCKKVRDDGGYWNQIEEYVSEHTQAEFSHGICPECREKQYQRLDEDPTKN